MLFWLIGGGNRKKTCSLYLFNCVQMTFWKIPDKAVFRSLSPSKFWALFLRLSKETKLVLLWTITLTGESIMATFVYSTLPTPEYRTASPIGSGTVHFSQVRKCYSSIASVEYSIAPNDISVACYTRQTGHDVCTITETVFMLGCLVQGYKLTS